MKENNERKLELSKKFYTLGQNLMLEGINTSDEDITMFANIILLVSSMVNQTKNLKTLNEFCELFSSKGLIEKINLLDVLSTIEPKELPNIIDLIKEDIEKYKK
jgi:hypothetical protein